MTTLGKGRLGESEVESSYLMTFISLRCWSLVFCLVLLLFLFCLFLLAVRFHKYFKHVISRHRKVNCMWIVEIKCITIFVQLFFSNMIFLNAKYIFRSQIRELSSYLLRMSRSEFWYNYSHLNYSVNYMKLILYLLYIFKKKNHVFILQHFDVIFLSKFVFLHCLSECSFTLYRVLIPILVISVFWVH